MPDRAAHIITVMFANEDGVFVQSGSLLMAKSAE